jgi:hypothetical protein
VSAVGFSLFDGMDLAGVTPDELWAAYAALGGMASPARLVRQVSGELPMDETEHDLVAQALNEWFLDHGVDSFPVAYTRPAVAGARPSAPRRPAGSVSRQVMVSRQIRFQAASARHETHATCLRSAELRMTALRLRRRSI